MDWRKPLSVCVELKKPVCKGKSSGDGEGKMDSESGFEDVGPMEDTREYATKEKFFLFDKYLASIGRSRDCLKLITITH